MLLGCIASSKAVYFNT